MKGLCFVLFVLLMMCSCKGKESVTGYCNRLQFASEVNLLAEKAKMDTTKTAYSEQLSENKRMVETLIITEYDEKGNVRKETERKREIKQDSDKAIEAFQAVAVEEEIKDSLNHFENLHEIVESEVKEESIGGQESFGKWLGIVIGIAISFLIVYLWRKLRR